MPGQLVHRHKDARPDRGATAGRTASRPPTPASARTGSASSVDDHTWLVYAEELPEESLATAMAFLRRAWQSSATHGITIERIFIENGNCYRSRDFAAARAELGIRYRFTRPDPTDRRRTAGPSRWRAPCCRLATS